MNVAIALETRFTQTPDGAIWSSGWLSYPFWQRYLKVFKQVKVIARVATCDQPPPQARRADGPNVVFAALPFYVGPWQYAARRKALQQAIAQAMAPDDAVILRVPGTIGTLVERRIAKMNRPFGLEVVADPSEVFTNRGVKSYLNPLWRRYYVRSLKRQCARACAVSYVAREPLARLYPANPSAFTTIYSSIDLQDDGFVSEPEDYSKPPDPVRMVTVGSIEQLYKGPDLLIRAVAVASALGHNITATFVGEGKHRTELEEFAAKLGMGNRIRFTGRLSSGAQVRNELDRADLFVLPSRTEGLPRAMIEAMARGLPCIGTRVGGIPELLDGCEIVPVNDPEALARKIIEVAGDSHRLTRLSEENLKKARAYHTDELSPRRRAFYQAVYERTKTWIVQSCKRL